MMITLIGKMEIIGTDKRQTDRERERERERETDRQTDRQTELLAQ
jgi:hypothetical protein